MHKEPFQNTKMAGLGAIEEAADGAAAKREAEDAVCSKQEEVDTQPHKRARTDGEAADGSSTAVKDEVKAECEKTETEAAEGSPAPKLPKVEILPALALEQAVQTTAAASGLKVELTKTRVEVCWEVADDEAEDPRTITLW